MPPDIHTDAVAVIAWALDMHPPQPGVPSSARELVDRWFTDAAARWPAAWRAARRSPRVQLWLAAQSAGLVSFDGDARERYAMRSRLRGGVSGQPEELAQLLAVSDILRELGAIPGTEVSVLPEPLTTIVRPPRRHAA